MRLHLAFRNIRESVVEAARTLADSQPSRMDPADREVAGQEFCDVAAKAYGIPAPVVRIGGAYTAWDWSPAYSDEDQAEIVVGDRSRFLLHLFQAFRYHMVQCGRNSVGEYDAMKWAYSLFYQIRPVTFRKMARKRLLTPAVSPKDTFTTETWQKMVSLGLAIEDGFWYQAIAVPNFSIDMIAAVESGEVTVSDLIEAEDGLDDSEQDDDEMVEIGGGDPTEDQTVEADAAYPAVEDGVEYVDTISGTGIVEPAPDQPVPVDGPPTVNVTLDSMGITELRRLSRGIVSGGYSMRKPDLIAALRAAGVREVV